MKWHWKVRLYRDDGFYYYANVETNRDLGEITIIKQFYEQMTECTMVLEGMSESTFEAYPLNKAFAACWKQNPPKLENSN